MPPVGGGGQEGNPSFIPGHTWHGLWVEMQIHCPWRFGDESHS